MTDDGIVFIDSDIICYKLGFVGQVNSVIALENGIELGEFSNKTEAIESLEASGYDIEALEFETKVTPKPWEQVKTVGRSMIKNIVEKSGCTKYRLYIDGGENFRSSLGKIKSYKGTRNSAKPFYFKEVKEWLICEMGAIVIEGIEVDDAISIATSMGYQQGKKWVGATIDKDAYQTEGLLFNWDKMTEPQLITPLEGAKSLWKQMLTGDNIDNIQGCRGVGAKSALLSKINECKTEPEMYKIVRDKYFEVANKKGLVVTLDGEELNPLEEMRENMLLLYMNRRKPKLTSEGKRLLEWDTTEIGRSWCEELGIPTGTL